MFSFAILQKLGSVRLSLHLNKSVWDGDIIPQINDSSPTDKIFATLWFMKKEAYADSTIKAVGKRLKHLMRSTSLNNSELVKGYIAQKNCSMAFKESLVEAYDIYCRANSLSWNKPFYERYDKQPKIPTEEKLNMIIAVASRKFALILSMEKDLGTRPIELTWLRVKDVDLESGVITITSAKHCVGRTLKLKPQTLAMLKTYISEKKLNQNDIIFPVQSSTISENYRRIRNRLAEKLDDPALKSIRLYDFRHFKASMTYHQTKDLLFVQRLLGHKDLRTTLRYTQLIDFPNDEYVSAVAKDSKEACKLVENSFEYVVTIPIENIMLFRKRK